MRLPLLLLAAAILAGGEPSFQPAAGFTERDGLLVLAGGKEGQLRSDAPLAPGQWLLRGEFRCQGLGPTGLVAIDVQASGRKAGLSPYVMTAGSAEWAPIALPVRVEQPEVAVMRVGNWRGAEAGASLQLRNIALVPFPFEAPNWLASGGWDAGRPGEIPVMWEWKGKQAPEAGGIALAENTGFRTGRHVLVLRGGGESRVLAYPDLPMPPRGEVEVSVWARSANAARRPFSVWLYAAGWKPRVTIGGEAGEAWHRFSGVLAVEKDKPTFGVRIDMPAGAGDVELADMRVTWHPEGRTDANGASELTRGWPGVPGRNLVRNPDFELDGEGWTYDSSWAKSLAAFRGIAAQRQVLLVDGGVDGGHCARLEGPSSFRSEMFPVKTGSTYSVSMQVRLSPGSSAGDLNLSVIDHEWGWLLGRKVEDAGPAWKRYEWTFTASKPIRLGKAYLRLDSKAGIEVDRIQVEEGAKATAWEAPVMLGLLRDGPPYVVRGRDRTGFSVRVVLDGKGPADLAVVARDAWGAEAWRLERQVDASGDIPVEVPTARLGHFHVELTARRAGAVVGIGAARYAIIDPPRLEEAPAGRFGLLGVCHEVFNHPLWWNQVAAAVWKDLGVRSVRFFAQTPADLPDPLPGDVAESLRAALKALQDQGIRTLPCVGLFAPAQAAAATLAAATPEQVSGQRQAMERYVRALQPELRAVEIFNEPDLWRIATGPDAGKRTMTPPKYVQFQQAGFEAARAVDPRITVVACGLNTARFDWLEDWAKVGGGRWMDLLSWHGYGSWGGQIPGESERIRAIFAKAGTAVPVMDSEMYFAWRDFSQRTGTEEYFRGYFSDRELEAAGRSIQFWIGHAAAGVPFCHFAPFITVMCHGPGHAIRTWDLFAALNAASRFLVGAGPGEVVETGLPYTAVLFPEAEGGPLLAVWAGDDVQGSLRLSGDFAAYDLMGNAYTAEQRAAGVRLASDPAWIRFPAATSPVAVRAALAAATALGLGPSVAVGVALGGPDTVNAVVTSRSNQPLSGKLRLLSVPEGWKPAAAEVAFAGLEPGRSRILPIPFTAMSAKDLGSYPIAAIVECGEDFARAQGVIRPLFVRHLAKVVADGDLGEWPAEAWLPLGEDHLSKAFGDQPHAGPADLAARLACAWTAEGLALAVVVRDDVHAPAESERIAWQGDSLQLYIDQLGDAARGAAHDADDIAYTIAQIGGRAVAWLDKGSEGHFKGEANKRDGFLDADPRLAIVRRGQDTVYEILLPWASCLPRVRPGPGNLGLSLLINDNDGKGRKTGITISPPGSEPYGAPWDWADAVLMP